MTRSELEEIKALPEKYRPLGAWKYFWLSVLYCIPFVGLVFIIIHAFSRSNINRRSFARSFFVPLAISVIVGFVALIISAIGAIAGSVGLFEKIKELLNSETTEAIMLYIL